MKVALVHDYIKEYGGAERVLRVLADMYPEAPIYTAFKVDGSVCEREFIDRKIVESPWAFLIKRWNLYSPLRFLVPLVWGSLDLSEYDLVITSCSSYFARGFKMREGARLVAYCHTPPRFLYGYEMSLDLMKYWPVRVYAAIVNHFLRIFDLNSSRRVDQWIVNSENVRQRVWKYYRKEAKVIYPPVEVERINEVSRGIKKEDYYLIVSRLAGAKGLVEAAKALKELGLKLKIVGESAGYSVVESRLQKIKSVELMGRVDDEKLYKLYAGARGFIALAREEDFGITVVEAMAAGVPVIAYRGGGFLETVVERETGIFVDGQSVNDLSKAVNKMKKIKWDEAVMLKQARRFSREEFVKKWRKVVS